MNVMKKIGLISVAVLQLNIAMAEDCQEIPSCRSLGFSMTTEQCAGKYMLRCPFDRTNNEAVWCHKGVAGLRCSAGNYFNTKTGSCYPKNISDYIFIDDEADLKAVVLQISATRVIKGTSYDEFIKAGKGKDILSLRYFHKMEDYLFKNFGSGCYIVSDDSTDGGALVYLSSNRIGVKLNQLSFQKYCFLGNEEQNKIAQASLLKYQLFDYHWK